jgi:hypothetical protein
MKVLIALIGVATPTDNSLASTTTSLGCYRKSLSIPSRELVFGANSTRIGNAKGTRPIIDRSGFTEKYNFLVEFTRQQNDPLPPGLTVQGSKLTHTSLMSAKNDELSKNECKRHRL